MLRVLLVFMVQRSRITANYDWILFQNQMASRHPTAAFTMSDASCVWFNYCCLCNLFILSMSLFSMSFWFFNLFYMLQGSFFFELAPFLMEYWQDAQFLCKWTSSFPKIVSIFLDFYPKNHPYNSRYFNHNDVNDKLKWKKYLQFIRSVSLKYMQLAMQIHFGKDIS